MRASARLSVLTLSQHTQARLRLSPPLLIGFLWEGDQCFGSQAHLEMRTHLVLAAVQAVQRVRP